MKNFKLCSLLLLAACAVGCGKEDPAADAGVSSAPPDSTDFDSLMSKAASSVVQKDAGAAMEAAEKALELRPESAEACLLAGQAAYRGEDFKQARAHFTAVTKEVSLPSALRAKAYAGLGMVDYVQHDYDMARIEFLHALALDPQNEVAYYHLGKLYEEVYHFLVAAQDQFKIFVSLSNRSHPGNARAQKVKDVVMPRISREIAAQREANSGNATKAAQLVQAAQALRKKDPVAATKKYDEARKVDPQSYDAALGYAELVKETEKTAKGAKKAIEAYIQAAALKPGLQENYLAAARLARKYDSECKIQAAEIMNRAVAYHPQDPTVLGLLYSSLQRVGSEKLAAAWSEYRRTLKR